MQKQKRNYQDVKFNSVSEFLDYLPAHELQVVQWLRGIICQTVPHINEKLAYNVPYFYGNSRVCFIWPSAIKWGNIAQNGVRLGFVKGYLLNNDLGFLKQEHRKQVCWIEYEHIVPQDETFIKMYLYEAWILDKKKNS
jgi:hypothetical protein